MPRNTEIEYEIEKEIGVLGQSFRGWQKELNLIRWNGKNSKFDIRDWSPNHESMSKGITLNEDEARALYCVLGEYFEKNQ